SETVVVRLRSGAAPRLGCPAPSHDVRGLSRSTAFAPLFRARSSLRVRDLDVVDAPVVFADLLGAVLAHEQCGMHLYRAVAGATQNPVLKSRYTESSARPNSTSDPRGAHRRAGPGTRPTSA